MHLCFSCISYLSFGIEIAGETKPQQHAGSICWLHPFSRARTKVIEVMMLIKFTGDSVKFIGSEYIQESLINMTLQLYISYLNKHIFTLHINISLRLLPPVNTLNSK